MNMDGVKPSMREGIKRPERSNSCYGSPVNKDGQKECGINLVMVGKMISLRGKKEINLPTDTSFHIRQTFIDSIYNNGSILS